MKSSTRKIIKTAMVADGEISEAKVREVLKILERNNDDAELRVLHTITTRDAVRMTGYCSRTLARYAKAGVIRRTGGATRWSRWVREDIEKLCRGEIPKLTGAEAGRQNMG